MQTNNIIESAEGIQSNMFLSQIASNHRLVRGLRTDRQRQLVNFP